MFYKAIRVYVEQDESSFVWIAVLLTQMLTLFCYFYLLQCILDSSLNIGIFTLRQQKPSFVCSIDTDIHYPQEQPTWLLKTAVQGTVYRLIKVTKSVQMHGNDLGFQAQKGTFRQF